MHSIYASYCIGAGITQPGATDWNSTTLQVQHQFQDQQQQVQYKVQTRVRQQHLDLDRPPSAYNRDPNRFQHRWFSRRAAAG